MKETVHVCDRCGKKGPDNFTSTVYFTYDRRWDGVENADDDAKADLCCKCACDCLRDFVKAAGHNATAEYIRERVWLKRLAGMVTA